MTVAKKEAQQSVLTALKGVKLSVDEQDFIKEYRKLEELEREKGIKFFECVGDPPHTDEFVEEVNAKRNDLITSTKNEMRHEDCSRFVTETDRDKVVVATTALHKIVAKPNWDSFENNHFAMRRRLVSIFLRVGNKVMNRLRAGRRLKKLQTWIEANGIRSRADMRQKVAEDFKKAQNTRMNDTDEKNDDIGNIRF